MKTLVVIDSVSHAAGGLLAAELGLQQALDRVGVGVSIHSLHDEQTGADLALWLPLKPDSHRVRGPSALGASGLMQKALLKEEADLIYRAGLWRLPSKYAHGWSRTKQKPEIIAPHGMLDPWAVRNSRWKKRVASLWFEAAHLADAACFRALCQSEADAIRAYGLANPIAIIPNGVDLPLDRAEAPERSDSGPKVLLFLGRIHPKKGLGNALRAWHAEWGSRAAQGWRFVIAGWDQGGHRAELEALCRELGLSVSESSLDYFLSDSSLDGAASVLFPGPVFGEQKEALLRRADAFILPSFSEGLPMAVLEAWAYKLPVLMSDHCNLPEGFNAGAAIRIGTSPRRQEAGESRQEAGMPIAEGLRTLFEMSDEDRITMGHRGRLLVEQQFTWPQVARQMKAVYEWILGGAEPEGVELRR